MYILRLITEVVEFVKYPCKVNNIYEILPQLRAVG
jgi:hypothetical protein